MGTGILLWKELQSETWSIAQTSLVTGPDVKSLVFLFIYLGQKDRFQRPTWPMGGCFSSWARDALSWFWLLKHSESLLGVTPDSQKVPQGPQGRTSVNMEGWEEWRGLYWGLPPNSHGSYVLKQNIRPKMPSVSGRGPQSASRLVTVNCEEKEPRLHQGVIWAVDGNTFLAFSTPLFQLRAFCMHCQCIQQAESSSTVVFLGRMYIWKKLLKWF